jgi:two-component system, OmpR family, response regulator ChvI
VLPDQNSNSNTKKKRILAVDDEPDITLTVKAGLEATGLFQVNTFNDPELALSSFKPRLYDIVLLDFKMPKMYGYELYDEMKKIDNKVKVCFMTATYQNYEGLRTAFPTIELECYIQKPVANKDLIRRVTAVLEQQ